MIMATNVDRKAKNVRSKIQKLLARYGRDILVQRPAYQDADSNLIEPRPVTYLGLSTTLHRSETPNFTDQAGFASAGDDAHAVLFDYLADVKEGYMLTFNGAEWDISRWDPEYVGNYLVAQYASVVRRGPQ